MVKESPAQAIEADEAAHRVPDPRKHYSGPEELFEDVSLDAETRESLLVQWKDEVDSELLAEAEGMSASDPIGAEEESRLAAEARRVAKALAATREVVAAKGD